MAVVLSVKGLKGNPYLGESEHWTPGDNKADLLQVSVAQRPHLKGPWGHLHPVQPLCCCPVDVLQVPACKHLHCQIQIGTKIYIG